MRLLVDAGPYLVNKTAMSRVVADTLAALRSEDIRTRALYFSRPGILLRGWHVKLARKLFSLCLRAPLAFLFLRFMLGFLVAPAKLLLTRRSRDPEKVLYFDPLYTLFHADLDRAVVFVLDLTPITFSDWHPRFVVWLYRVAFRRLAASTCRIVSISGSTTDDLRVNLGIHHSRITTLLLYGPDFTKAKEVPGPWVADLPKQKYFLFVGSQESRKNLLGLIYAFAISGLHREGYQLLIAGGAGHGAWEIQNAADKFEGVRLLGYVNDAELEALYKHAIGFAYPSYWEGFGVPLLEAMARGVPCLSTMTGASPEVGGAAPIYVDPCDLRDVAHGLKSLANLSEEERSRRTEVGRSIASQFSFERYINGLRAVLEESP